MRELFGVTVHHDLASLGSTSGTMYVSEGSLGWEDRCYTCHRVQQVCSLPPPMSWRQGRMELSRGQ